MPFPCEPHMRPRPSTPTLKILFLRLALTCTASSILREFQWRLHARAASLLRLSGGAPIAFLHSYFVRGAAEGRTSCFLFTGFKNGWENTLCNRGCGRQGDACNLGAPVIHAQIKLCAIIHFML